MNPLRSAANRTLLALIGIMLLTGGGWLATSASTLTSRLPSWWPTADSGSVLLDRQGLASVRTHGWWAPAVIAASALILLLFLLWFLSQVGTGGHRRLPLASSHVDLRSSALADVLAQRAGATPGVARAQVALVARPKRLHARARLVLEPGSPPVSVLERFSREALDEAHRCATPRGLDAHVRIGTRTRPARRTR